MSGHAWMDRGACRDVDPAVFFPEPGKGNPVNVAISHAKAICAGCPVRLTCLDYALDNRINHGVWGGKSERQRKAILKYRGTHTKGEAA